MKFGLNFTLNLRNFRAKFDGVIKCVNFTLNLLNLRDFRAKFTRFNCDFFGGTILIVRNLRNLHDKIYGVIKCVNFAPNLLNLHAKFDGLNFTPNLSTKKESKNA